MNLLDLRKRIVCSSDLANQDASPDSIASIAMRSKKWGEDAFRILRGEGFITPALRGFAFANIGPSGLPDRIAYISGIEQVAVTRESAKSKQDLTTLLMPILLASRASNRHAFSLAYQALMQDIIGRNDSDGLAQRYRQRANDALAFAWAQQLTPTSMNISVGAVETMVDRMHSGDARSAAILASQVRQASSNAYQPQPESIKRVA